MSNGHEVRLDTIEVVDQKRTATMFWNSEEMYNFSYSWESYEELVSQE